MIVNTTYKKKKHIHVFVDFISIIINKETRFESTCKSVLFIFSNGSNFFLLIFLMGDLSC